MTSYQKLIERGLPLGPFAAPVPLHARWRGRRLHVRTDCPVFQAMNPNRKHLVVPVLLSELDPAKHLCHRCGYVLDAELVNKNAPAAPGGANGAQRVNYLTRARHLTAAWDYLARARDTLEKAGEDVSLPDPALLVCLKKVSNAVCTSATLSDVAYPGSEQLDPLFDDVEQRRLLMLSQARHAWDNDAGRRTLVRMAQVERDVKKVRGGHRLSIPTSGPAEAAAAIHALEQYSWGVRAVNTAWSSWVRAVRRGLFVAAAEREALRDVASAACFDSLTALSGVPAVRTPAPGENLADYTVEQVQAHVSSVVQPYIDRWAAPASDSDVNGVVLVRLTKGSAQPVALCSPVASYAGAELLAVPEGVLAETDSLRLQLSVPQPHLLPRKVLETALRLIVDGAKAQIAFDAAIAVHHDLVVPATV